MLGPGLAVGFLLAFPVLRAGYEIIEYIITIIRFSSKCNGLYGVLSNQE